jgi:hypothetical protein
MCPACLASAPLIIASVMSTGGLTALVVKKLGAKNSAKESLQNPIPKEETWEK